MSDTLNLTQPELQIVVMMRLAHGYTERLNDHRSDPASRGDRATDQTLSAQLAAQMQAISQRVRGMQRDRVRELWDVASEPHPATARPR